MIAIPAGFNPEDYLALERDNTVRHEYRRGLVYAMAGGSDDHSRLCINFITAINLHLRDGDSQFFSADVKVNYADAFFYYPDAFVTVDLRDREDGYVKRYPKLIAEVLSPSTENFDRGEKFEDYQQLESLEEHRILWGCCWKFFTNVPSDSGSWVRSGKAGGNPVALRLWVMAGTRSTRDRTDALL